VALKVVAVVDEVKQRKKLNLLTCVDKLENVS